MRNQESHTGSAGRRGTRLDDSTVVAFHVVDSYPRISTRPMIRPGNAVGSRPGLRQPERSEQH